MSGVDMRLSLAGAQSKIALSYDRENKKFYLPSSDKVTNVILKPPIQGVSKTSEYDTVYNEFFIMRLASKIGINVPYVDVCVIEDLPVFMIERYDRVQFSDGDWCRLHQEDFCQAISIVPEKKYQNQGGPSFEDCNNLIEKHSTFPIVDRLKILESFIFNYLIGNNDAHGKNFSMLHEIEEIENGHITGRKFLPQITPFYDLLSVAVYDGYSKKMAMNIGGEYKPNFVFERHWELSLIHI